MYHKCKNPKIEIFKRKMSDYKEVEFQLVWSLNSHKKQDTRRQWDQYFESTERKWLSGRMYSKKKLSSIKG